MKNQLLSTLLILAFSISAFTQEIVYTVTARSGLQTIALDSILIENLTNHSRLLFTNLPNFESYEIDLTSQTIGDVETGINIVNQGISDFVVVQNQPGLMVLNYHGNRSLDVRVSVVNLNGQVSYISDKQLLNPISTMVIQLGHPGVYLVKVESEGGVQTFKAVGALTGQSFKVSQGNAGRQSLGLKSSGDSDIDDFSFETGDELRLTAYKNGYHASPKTLIVSASQQIEFEFSLINIIRGGPAATNPMAVPIQITGVSANPYSSNLNQWTGSWEAPQAIYDQDIYVNDPDNWSNILSNSDAGTTWSNLNPGIGYGILVVDLEQAREITSISVFQMFSDGKITHIALAGHPEINSTAPDALDENWHEFLGKSIVGAGTDGVSYVYNPTKYFVEAQTRYVKIMAFNDGSYGNSSYIELKGIKMYGGVANSFALNLEVFPEGSGQVSGDGLYSEGTQVEIMATPNEGYTFINWTGDTEYVDDSNVPNSTLMMPAKNITLTAIFEGNNGEGDATEVVEVLNPVTGRIWMDRNLGASRAATSSNDTESYGDYYQWGRAADGHQKPNSGETSTRSTSDTPGHGLFITTGMGSSQDWRSPPNHNLWQGVYGTNNPCPIGYRLPTDAELNANRLSWSSNNAAGAFSSPLKLPIAALRPAHTGSLGLVRSFGYYWSSTVDGDGSRCLYFDSSKAEMRNCNRSWANSVRCLKVLF
ncbi:InlB B-repeat-containing protein [Geofilum rubicundum]|uniref:Bacterial repeat domain-containing protein n=1 Tax=Geofilum rubicundum JCM 15548 TaxID=1236989 RepID=A0A0E9M223_9BACT|nr:T9SS type A sorting domain-containing protein [Geofilum rubicundum]GAO31643.1 hypothetical protein JCM15548_14027 [Geofilum rubicundum JCM 15548]